MPLTNWSRICVELIAASKDSPRRTRCATKAARFHRRADSHPRNDALGVQRTGPPVRQRAKRATTATRNSLKEKPSPTERFGSVGYAGSEMIARGVQSRYVYVGTVYRTRAPEHCFGARRGTASR